MAWGTTQRGADTLPLGSVQVPDVSNPLPLQGSLVQHTDGSSNLSSGIVAVDQLMEAVMLGKAYAATTGFLTTLTNGNLVMGAALFNAATAKNMYVYSAEFSTMNAAAPGTMQLRTLTSNPAYATTLTPINLKQGGAASVATVTCAATSATASIATPGTVQDVILTITPGTYEFLDMGEGIYLPAGVSAGIGVYDTVITAANTWAVSFRWIEF